MTAIRRVPFLDLRITDPREREVLLQAIDAVFQHGRLVMGPELDQLEQKVAESCGRPYAVGVNSGTDALYLGLRALGYGPGDEVITTSLSWIATANAIALTGATPVFADIRDDLNIDPASIARLITPQTRAILPVHYTGKICDMPEILRLARRHHLAVIEDASQAFGARLGGQPAGSFGQIACFSMNPMKVFAACGEAGIVVTDEPELQQRLQRLRYNGTVNKEVCLEPSLNGRLDTLQAAILLKRLERVPQVIAGRRQIAAWYDEWLDTVVRTPSRSPEQEDVYYTYTIQAERRDELKEYLAARGIETKVQHPILMPHQPAYETGVRGEFARADHLVKRILCIPAHEKLRREDAEYVAGCIRGFYQDKT